jgi:hypothetical protein
MSLTVPSDLQANAANPLSLLIKNPSRIRGVSFTAPDKATLATWIAEEVSRIAADPSTFLAAAWPDAMPIRIQGESPATHRIWDRAGQHANTVVLPDGSKVTVSGTIVATAGKPDNVTGSDGDHAFDDTSGIRYVKSSGTWSDGTPVAKLPVITSSDPASVAIPPTGFANIFLDSTNSGVLSFKDSTGSVFAISTAGGVGGGGTGGVVTSVTIAPATGLVHAAGLPLQFSAVVDGTGSYANTVIWTVSNTSIATINSSGLLTGVSQGTVTVTAKSTADHSVTATATVTVAPAWVITGVTLSSTILNLVIGDTTQLTATASGTGSFPTNIVWSSSDPSKATVDGNGFVTVIAAGTPTITAMSADGTQSVTCSLVITAVPDITNQQNEAFTYATGVLEGRGGWLNAVTNQGFLVSGNKVYGTTATDEICMCLNTRSISADQVAEIELQPIPDGSWTGVVVRGNPTSAIIVNINNTGGTYTLHATDYLFSGGGSALIAGITLSGAPATGTKLRVVALARNIAVYLGGVLIAKAHKLDLTASGSPGIAMLGNQAIDNFMSADFLFSVSYNHTDANGVEYYDVLSNLDIGTNGGITDLFTTARVLKPTAPAGGTTHNILYTLPVEPYLGENGTGWVYGDIIEYARTNDWHNTYNTTFFEPNFTLFSWYSNSDINPGYQYETKVTRQFYNWAKANLETTGTEKHNLLSYSKGGIGGMMMFLRHPNLWHRGAFWDFPTKTYVSYNSYGQNMSDGYGTDSNFQANYRPTFMNLVTRAEPFSTENRMWVGGARIFDTDINYCDPLLTSAGILHTFNYLHRADHSWESGWVPDALTFLFA